MASLAEDPAPLLWQAALETGGNWDRRRAEGTKWGREIFSYGAFQMNEEWARGLYDMRGLLGPTLSMLLANKAPPPADQTQLHSWLKPLSTLPWALLYPLINVRQFIRHTNVYYARSGWSFSPKPKAAVLKTPGTTEANYAHAVKIHRRCTELQTTTGVPAYAILMRAWWFAGSWPGMASVVTTRFIDAYTGAWAANWQGAQDWATLAHNWVRERPAVVESGSMLAGVL